MNIYEKKSFFTAYFLFAAIVLYAGGYTEHFESFPRGGVERIRQLSIDNAEFLNRQRIVVKYNLSDYNEYNIYTITRNSEYSNFYSVYKNDILVLFQSDDSVTNISFRNDTGFYERINESFRTLSTYNDEYEITSEENSRFYSDEWNTYRRTEFEYRNGSIERSYVLINGFEINQILYFYDGIDRPNKDSYYIYIGDVEEQEYNESSYRLNIHEIRIHSPSGTLKFVRIFHEDDTGYGSRGEYSSLEEAYDGITEEYFVFDKYGNLAQHILYYNSGEIFRSYEYIYQFDRMNNWIVKEIWDTINNTCIRRVYREIEYL